MSSPNAEWGTRLREVGGVDARRIFSRLDSPSGGLKIATAEVAAGRMPVLSFKVPNNDWKGAANGRYDVALRTVRDRLDALPGPVFVAIHHEPVKDGTPADYAAMQRHVLPLLSPPDNVEAGVIVHGWFWSSAAKGLTDAQIAQWLPSSVLRVAEVVAADTYHGGTARNPGEDAATKIRNLSRWATRVGVRKLGLGEYNGHTAASLKSAGDAVLADPRFSFATVFNSNRHNRDGVDWVLKGDRLDAFRATVRQSRQ